MSGTALIGCARHGNGNAVSRRFEAGKEYTSSDGTIRTTVLDIRRGKYSCRALAKFDGSAVWCEVGNAGGCEVITLENRRGVFVVIAGKDRR